MRNLFALVLLTVCLFVSSAPGDISPDLLDSWQKRSSSKAKNYRPGLPPGTAVRMVGADVKINLKPHVVRRWLFRKETRVLADVVCTFDMSCLAARVTPTTFLMGFPLYLANETAPKVVGFSVDINGEEPSKIKRTSWRLPGTKGESMVCHGYAWPTSVWRGRKQHVSVHYSIILPKDGKTNTFKYFLRSGAEWSGTLGKEIVSITADDALDINIVTPEHVRPMSRSDHEIVWEIVDTEPTEDICLQIAVTGDE